MSRTTHTTPGVIAPGRDQRARIAEATVAACTTGRYQTSDNRTVELRDAIDAAVAGTVAYDLDRAPVPADRPAPTSDTPRSVTVTPETTVEALRRLDGARAGAHLACLNFASAKNPGGGFLGGAHAQEESLARSSGLYPCLLGQPAHYRAGRSAPSALYRDVALF